MNCSKCGSANSEQHKFCSECGAPLMRAGGEAERRSLTVMFCDLAGSTALSERFDPEDLQQILTAYQDCCRVAIDRYDGFIARYMGDGILVYFGYPTAHEDDAQRSIRAALDIADAVPRLAILPDCRLAVRVGIATGDVVIGDLIGEGVAEERAVLGLTPNLAARLQGLAQENEIVVSEATRQRLGQSFSLHDLGTFPLKGINAPSQAWRVDGLAKASPQVASTAEFVGREEIIARLGDAFTDAGSGTPGIIHLSGQAGMGKTRLLSEFISRHDETQSVVWACSAFQRNVPLHPISTDLLDINGLPGETGEAQRRTVFDQVANRLAQKALSAPLVLIVEDAHWIDPTTTELLVTMHRWLGEQGILVIVAARPGEIADNLADQMGGARIALEALKDSEASALVNSLVGDGVSEEACRKIIERAGGLPLFIEELANVVASAQSVEVPVTLQESLLARLDGLGTAKRIAQLASIFGRTFAAADLEALTETNDVSLALVLDRLVSSGLLIETREGYSFRHALMQEVAYETLLRSTRKRIHGEIADRVIATLGDSSPQLVARHLSGAERFPEAIPYWCVAARRSAGLWAHAEATAFFAAALQHAPSLADDKQELAVRLDFVESLRILDDYGEALRQLDLSEALAQRVGADEDWLRLHVLRGNILFPMGEGERCIASHEAALALARRMSNPEAEARALSGLGDAHFADGRLTTAECAYDSCVTIADENELTAVTLANVSLRGHMRLYLCRIEEAETDCRRAVEMALDLGNRRAEMTARGSCLGKVLLEAGQFSAADRAFSEGAQIATDLGAHRYEAMNLLFRGKVALDTGARADALAFGQRAVAIARQYGPKFCLPMAIGVVARAEETPEACKASLDEAEAVMAAGCLAHNPLWFYRDAALAAVAHGWPGEARRYARLLRQAFALEPLAWIDLIADGADALAERFENDDAAALKTVIQRARDCGFLGWARVLIDAGKLPR